MRRTRKRLIRKPKKIIAILCEGETEINYFCGLFYSKLENDKYFVLKIYQPHDHSPYGIVTKCVEENKKMLKDKIKKSDISIWAVFDRNGHARIHDAFQKANSNGVNIIFSSKCFEYWILLHYKETTRPAHNCDEVIKDIVNHPDADDNFLKSDDHYEKLKEKIDDAIENNKKIINQMRSANLGKKIYELDPFTNAHELVEHIKDLT